MPEAKMVDAIVRGPMPHFGKDGVLYMPGQVVTGVPAADVSADDSRTITVQVEARNGDLRDRDIDKAVVFRPLSSSKDEPTIAAHVDTATVATGQPDRLNVTDFLKQGDDHIIAAIVSGSVDDHLGVIEQAVIAGKVRGRGDVKEAISARMAVMSPVR